MLLDFAICLIFATKVLKTALLFMAEVSALELYYKTKDVTIKEKFELNVNKDGFEFKWTRKSKWPWWKFRRAEKLTFELE